jgi:hypothetical protein
MLEALVKHSARQSESLLLKVFTETITLRLECSVVDLTLSFLRKMCSLSGECSSNVEMFTSGFLCCINSYVHDESVDFSRKTSGRNGLSDVMNTVKVDSKKLSCLLRFYSFLLEHHLTQIFLEVDCCRSLSLLVGMVRKAGGLLLGANRNLQAKKHAYLVTTCLLRQQASQMDRVSTASFALMKEREAKEKKWTDFLERLQ